MTDPSIDQHGSTEGSSARWWPWVVGLVGAAVVLGPVLGPGSILRLDFIALPELPVPRGVWGLGPELPRRLPLMLPLAWLSPLIGGSAGIKAVLLAGLAGGFVGACRLAQPAALPWRLGAGALYALSPFALTRVGVGHIFIIAGMGLLPWAVPTLLQPHRSVRRTLLWSAALGFTGFYGGFLAAALVGAGLVRARGARLVPVVAATAVGQLPWLVPGFVVASQGQGYAGAAGFRADIDGWDGPLRLLAGHGFWQPSYQVGIHEGPWVGLLGAGVLVLALVGRRRLAEPWGAPLTWVGLAAVVVTAASGWGPTTGLTGTVVDTLAPAVRETQRLLVLYLVWAAPAAVLGAQTLADRRPRSGWSEALRAFPLVAGLVLMAPGAWGIGGALRPVHLPAEWREVADTIDAEPGTVLALPWAQYLDLLAADGERVLDPLPIYLGRDVLATSDLGVESGNRERNDPREDLAAGIAADLLAGEQVTERLAAIGVRWVVLLHETDREWEFYQVALEEDSGVEPVLEGLTISLYRVPGWTGPIVTDEGEELSPDALVAPYQALEASGPAVWNRPAAPGWRRGWATTTTTDQGLVGLPGGRGPLWYWPAVVCILADLVTLAAVVWAAWPRRRRPRAPVTGGSRPPASVATAADPVRRD